MIRAIKATQEQEARNQEAYQEAADVLFKIVVENHGDGVDSIVSEYFPDIDTTVIHKISYNFRVRSGHLTAREGEEIMKEVDASIAEGLIPDDAEDDDEADDEA